MLNFDSNHRLADMSEIKSKIEKVRKIGKVMIGGIVLSAVLLSGCGTEDITINEQTEVTQPITPSTAIVMENGNAMIVDLQSYDKYTRDMGSVHYSTFAEDRIWVLYTSNGDRMLMDYDSVKFIDGENSHEKAEIIAQALVGPNGQVTCYDEVILDYDKTK